MRGKESSSSKSHVYISAGQPGGPSKHRCPASPQILMTERFCFIQFHRQTTTMPKHATFAPSAPQDTERNPRHRTAVPATPHQQPPAPRALPSTLNSNATAYSQHPLIQLCTTSQASRPSPHAPRPLAPHRQHALLTQRLARPLSQHLLSPRCDHSPRPPRALADDDSTQHGLLLLRAGKA